MSNPLTNIYLKLGIAILTTACLGISQAVQAQIIPDSTTATQVTGNTISPTNAGTVTNGNLFHSFNQFNVPLSGVIFSTGNSQVNGASIANIINRVTGNTPSSILGLIQSRPAFPNANVYLVNPNGIVFGSNASLDIGGSFHASTGTALAFPNGQIFSAKSEQVFPSGEPNQIRFGINQPAAILNQGNLAVNNGRDLTLVGGTVINTGNLSAPNGQIGLGAVPGNSTVELRSPDAVLSLNVSAGAIASDWQGTITEIPALASLLTGEASEAQSIMVKPDGSLALLTAPSLNLNNPIGKVVIASNLIGDNTNFEINATNDILVRDIQTNGGNINLRSLSDIQADNLDSTSPNGAVGKITLKGNNLNILSLNAQSSDNSLNSNFSVDFNDSLTIENVSIANNENSDDNNGNPNAISLITNNGNSDDNNGNSNDNSVSSTLSASVSNNLGSFLSQEMLPQAFDLLEKANVSQLESYLGKNLNTNTKALDIEDGQQQIARSSEITGSVSALIYPVILSDRLEILVIPATGSPFRKVVYSAPAKVINPVIAAFKSNLQDPFADDYLVQAKQLYDWLIRPINEDLQSRKVSTLIFVMDGALRVIPPAALHDGKKFLVERYASASVPTMRLSNLEPRNRLNNRVLAMGLTESVQGFAPLPSVEVEINTITSANEGLSGVKFLNQPFTIENLKAQRQQQYYSIVHLATHADFLSNKAEDAFIQFWQERLKLSEIPKLNLSNPPVELLILSACKTAVGNNLGISGVALESGAKSVMASLWPISDAGTAPLMISFYSNLKDAPSKAIALQRAQLSLLSGQVVVKERKLTGIRSLPEISLPDTSNKINLAHPFYWSSFILVGNWL